VKDKFYKPGEPKNMKRDIAKEPVKPLADVKLATQL
jgi:hypothetical protein